VAVVVAAATVVVVVADAATKRSGLHFPANRCSADIRDPSEFLTRALLGPLLGAVALLACARYLPGADPMAQRRRPVVNKRQVARQATPTRSLVVLPPAQRVAPVVYGKPFILMEDASKNTFIYQAGNWVPYSSTIAECKQNCQVKVLPQSVGKMTRYEVRCPEGN
jgi:hypothetical protein